jgi:hypothetical protein
MPQLWIKRRRIASLCGFGINIPIVFILFISSIIGIHSQDVMSELLWLEGVWGFPGKSEIWVKTRTGLLEGNLFSETDGKKTLLENKVISRLGQSIVLTIHYPGTSKPDVHFNFQRKGNKYWFTNRSNDFPQVVIYERLRSSEFKLILGDFKIKDSREEVYFFKKTGGRRWAFY